MLAPDARQVAVELLRPPPGAQLDFAVLTTYTLDLDTLLALPLAVLARTDAGLDDTLDDPLLVLEAIRATGERMHVFCDCTGIAVPAKGRSLYAMLEGSVHPVRAPGGGVFHPKVWVARFVDGVGQPLIRVAVLSRNLTFDASWDIAFATDGQPQSGRTVRQSAPLAELLRELPGLALAATPVSDRLRQDIATLAAEVERTAFRAPEGFDAPPTFHALGLAGARKSWVPFKDGWRVLAIAPFVNVTALDVLKNANTGPRCLVSRQECLDALPEAALATWTDVWVLADGAEAEAVDGARSGPTGLHAKVIAVEHGWDVTWFVGSANLTAAAFRGHNVELMVSITGRKGRPGGKTGVGIDRFVEGKFLDKCCTRYVRRPQPDGTEAALAKARLEAALQQIAQADLRIVCTSAGGDWRWALQGVLPAIPDVEVAVWPASLAESHALAAPTALSWVLPSQLLTAFSAFRLRTPGADDARFVLKLPHDGMPEDRVAQVLRALVDTPDRLLRFLKALLAGLDGIEGSAVMPRGGLELDAAPQTTTTWADDALLEDLLRAASRDARRLEPVRRLIRDLRSTEEGRRVVPDDLAALWQVVDQVIESAEAK